MIQMLWGDDGSTRKALESCIGQKIKAATLDEEGDGALVLVMGDGQTLRLFDNGRSCCESRYLTCDDDLDQFIGAELIDIEVSDGPTVETEYGEPHETSFLRVKTSLGDIVATTHNEHNGYYGGFSIQASVSDPAETAKP